jgi:hypothetical protein
VLLFGWLGGLLLALSQGGTISALLTADSRISVVAAGTVQWMGVSGPTPRS